MRPERDLLFCSGTVNNELYLVIGIVAGALALLLIARPRRRPPLTLGLPYAPPRRLAVRASSLSRHIDECFDALEIKPTRLPSIDLVIEDTPLPPVRRAAHSMFDTSDAPLEVSDDMLTARTEFPVEATHYEVSAFAAEPTVTVVDDDDSASAVDELAAFLARDDRTPRRAARGSQAPSDPRARTILGVAMPRRRQSSPAYVDVTHGRADRARTPN